MEPKTLAAKLMETWPARMARDAYSALQLPGDVYQGNATVPHSENMGGFEDTSSIGRATDLAGLVTGGSYAVAPAQSNAVGMGIRAFHGSPHDFDKFDLSKIGTGEGAQAYGHGLYFAESEGVARSYREGLTRSKDHVLNADSSVTLPDWMAEKINNATDKQKAVTDLRATFTERLAEEQAALKTSGQPWMVEDRIRNMERILGNLDAAEKSPQFRPPGRMYEVDIKANPDQFLDWDKPLFQQGDIGLKAKSAAEKSLGIDDASGILNSSMGVGGFPNLKNEKFSQHLKDSGIPGIKYLDAGSRSAGDGSRNYVVFDPSIIEIMRKYGIAGLGVPGLAAGVPVNQEQ